MVDPKLLCRQHLLGEHREIHALAGIIRRGMKLDGYVANGLIETRHLAQRHEALAAEMSQRGYQHHSPFSQPACEDVGIVSPEESLAELRRRCTDCNRLMGQL